MRIIDAPVEIAIQALRLQIEAGLHPGKRVLWLLSGGSNIPISVQVMDAIPDAITKNLTISFVDERYGFIGHSESNAFKLQNAGFNMKQSTFIPVLEAKGLEATARNFSSNIVEALAHSDISIAQLGMGDDGHIAGVKPHTSAVHSQGLVASYVGSDYERITLTLPALRKMTSIYLLAYGENKKAQLLKLRDENLTIEEQPAQYLKTLPTVTVYNDQVEEGKSL